MEVEFPPLALKGGGHLGGHMSGMQLPTQEIHICQMPRMEKGGGGEQDGWGAGTHSRRDFAVDRGHPQVRRAAVNDDLELFFFF